MSLPFLLFLVSDDNRLAYPPLRQEASGDRRGYDTMPMVEPDSTANSNNYYSVTSAYYKSKLEQMQLTVVPRLFGSDTFTEYRFTVSTDQPQTVYALTSGYLYYLRRGQSYPYLLGSAVPDEDIIVLEPLPSSRSYWRSFHPEFAPFLTKAVYLNLDLDQASLKTQIETFHDVNFFDDLHKSVTGHTYTGSKSWTDAYYDDLFLEYPEATIIVQGGAVLGTTRADTSNVTAPQRLSLFFDLDGWAENEEAVKTFFTYRTRLPDHEGHPMISLLTGFPVEATYVDYVFLEGSPFSGRYKLQLQQLPFPFSETPPYHSIAIDPDQHPAALVIQKLPSSDVNGTALPVDYGITGLRLLKPLPTPLTVAGFDSAHVLVEQMSLSDTEELISFQATPMSPDELIVTVTTLDPDTGASIDIMRLNLVFLEFKQIPIRFHQLSDNFRTANINDAQLRQVVEIANYILGRQANVYIAPVEENGVVLHPLPFEDDLGEVLEAGTVWSYGLDKVHKHITDTPEYGDCNFVFSWELREEGTLLGESFHPKPDLGQLWRVNFVNVAAVDPSYEGDLFSVAETVVHELGHWISLSFIGDARDFFCTGGAEHFAHDTCTNGDHRLCGNLMAPGKSPNRGRLISVEQARIYNRYADQVR